MTKYYHWIKKSCLLNWQCLFRVKSRPGFSLIEVLFAITFLILVGTAMTSLNYAAARLTETTELKQMALGLNEQSLSFVALKKRALGGAFATTYQGCITPVGAVTAVICYVICPTDINQDCLLKLTREAVKVGTSKLQFVPSAIIRPTGSSYLVNATTSWGSGIQRQLTTARIIE